MRKILSVVLFITTTNLIFAQKNTTNQELIWYGYFTTLQFNDRWNLQTEIQERHFVSPLAQHQLVFRSHIHHISVNKSWNTSLGMCLFFQSPNNPYSISKLTVPELRPHVEITYGHKINTVVITHRLKTEARFFHNTNNSLTALEDGYDYGNIRIRYRLQAQIPLIKIDEKKSLKLKLSDEIHFMAANQISDNVFDQNRIYVGFNYDLLKNLSVEIGYLNWYQQRPNDDYYNRNILRFTVFHQINLKKKKENIP